MSNASNPYESTAAKPLSSPGKMEYMRSFHYVFENPNWGMNALWTGICLLSTAVIPIIGQLVIHGYQFEIVETLHRNPGTRYPDFDMNKLLDYLVRGFWVFLVTLVVTLCMLPIMIGLMVFFLVLIGAAGAAAGEEGAGVAMIVMMPLLFCIALAVGVLMNLVCVPFMLRAGLTQDFGAAFDFAFVKHFVRNTWKEMILSGLFLALAGFMLYLVGVAMLCIGVFFTMAIAMLMQAHLALQLYELHLGRGGEPIPLKPPAQEAVVE